MNAKEETKETDFNADFEDFEFDIDMFTGEEGDKPANDFARVLRVKRPKVAKYEYAEQMAKNIGLLSEGECVFATISGNFIAGDFIEAYLTTHKLRAETMLIATLSYSDENVDSLANLQAAGYIGELGLIVSDYFFSHERKNGIQYTIERLANENFSLAAAGIHTKITIIKTDCGRHLVIHGSANLRSSRNMEQLVVECNQTLYEFNDAWMRDLLTRYKATHKSLRADKLWQAIGG